MEITPNKQIDPKYEWTEFCQEIDSAWKRSSQSAKTITTQIYIVTFFLFFYSFSSIIIVEIGIHMKSMSVWKAMENQMVNLPKNGVSLQKRWSCKC